VHIHERGAAGEQLAADFLLKAGYQILERNWKFGRKEIDIICLYEHVLIFLEVKTRSNVDFGFPEEAVNPKKERAIVTTAKAYLHICRHKGEIRFDIVSVFLPDHSGRVSTNSQIHHIIDAFFPGP